MSAEVLMATPCTNSLGGESRGHRHEGGEGRSVCWKCAAVSWAGAGWPSMLIEGAEGLIFQYSKIGEFITLWKTKF